MTSSDHRLIVITGGGGGIGRATAMLCAKRGDRVAILDKNDESAKQPPMQHEAKVRVELRLGL